jgi:hypothetical protein
VQCRSQEEPSWFLVASLLDQCRCSTATPNVLRTTVVHASGAQRATEPLTLPVLPSCLLSSYVHLLHTLPWTTCTACSTRDTCHCQAQPGSGPRQDHHMPCNMHTHVHHMHGQTYSCSASGIAVMLSCALHKTFQHLVLQSTVAEPATIPGYT